VISLIKASAGGLAEKWPRPQVLVKIPLDELGLCMGALRSGTIGIELVDAFHAGNGHPEWRGELSRWLKVLGRVAGPVSVHAAHMGLNHLCWDAGIRQITLARYMNAISLARKVGARLVVFHSLYNPLLAGQDDSRWVAKSLEFWENLLPLGEEMDACFVIENCWEDRPDHIVALLEAASSPRLKACLDVGHVNAWSSLSPAEWIKALGSHLRHVHLHDNHARFDEHLAVGNGSIDFREVFDALTMLTVPSESPISFVLEVRDYEETVSSLSSLGWLAVLEG
jgi:sugar phosphate isomerase/epimerase